MKKDIFHIQRTVLLLMLVVSVIGIFGCKSNKVTVNYDTTPLSQSAVSGNPFGYEPSIKNFKKNIVPPYKLSLYTVQNQHQPSETDTIYQFSRKKSELFVFKNKFNREMFFAANICDDKIALINGVKVGINRAAFFNSFTDLKFSNNDTVKFTSKARMMNYKFVFKNDKLAAIKMDAYID